MSIREKLYLAKLKKQGVITDKNGYNSWTEDYGGIWRTNEYGELERVEVNGVQCELGEYPEDFVKRAVK